MMVTTRLSTYSSAAVTSPLAFAHTNCDNILRTILSDTQTIAVIGASKKIERDSNHVTKYLIDCGYVVYPVNPGFKNDIIHGRTVYGSIRELIDNDIQIDMIDIFRNSNDAGKIIDEVITINDEIAESKNKIKCVWMQIDVINQEAAQRAAGTGLNVAMNVCPVHEIPRLGIQLPRIFPSKET
jgi:uncharacterized protein